MPIVSIAIPQALTIATGITIGAVVKRALGLSGLAATVNQCESWRKAAAWITPNLTDAERRDAAQSYNSECRFTVASTAATAAEAIRQGQGDTEVEDVPLSSQPSRFSARQLQMIEASKWLREHSRPSPTQWPVMAKNIDPPTCGPLDGRCIKCAEQILLHNMAEQKNQSSRYQRAKGEYDCKLNTSTGKPERCYDYIGQNPITAAPDPVCAVTYSAGYVSPAATIDEEGQVIVDDTGPSFFTLLPEAQQEGLPLQASPATGQPVAVQAHVATATPPQTATPTGTPAATGGAFDWPALSLPTSLPAVPLPAPVQSAVDSLPVPQEVKSNAGLIIVGLIAAAVFMGGRR